MGRRRARPHPEAGRSSSGTRVHADSLRTARGRTRADASAARRPADVAGRRIARLASGAGGRPGAGGRRQRGERRRPRRDAAVACALRIARERGSPAVRRHRDRRPAACARRRLHPPVARGRPAAHAGRAAHRPQPARLRSVQAAQHLRGTGRARARPHACCANTRTTATRCPNRSPSCCGAPTQPQERRRGPSRRCWR